VEIGRRLARNLAVLACAAGLAGFSNTTCAAPPSPKEDARVSTSSELTPEALASLRVIAQKHPCAVLALLRILQSPPDTLDRSLYLTWIPSTATVTRFLGSPAEERNFDVIFAFQQNIYDEAVPRARIQWLGSPARGQSYSLSFRAELVDSQRVPLRPRHLLEEPVLLEVDGSRIRLTPSEDDAPYGAAL
jgi:hypothetical protein